jgi:hypothetical protein
VPFFKISKMLILRSSRAVRRGCSYSGGSCCYRQSPKPPRLSALEFSNRQTDSRWFHQRAVQNRTLMVR